MKLRIYNSVSPFFVFQNIFFSQLGLRAFEKIILQKLWCGPRGPLRHTLINNAKYRVQC